MVIADLPVPPPPKTAILISNALVQLFGNTPLRPLVQARKMQRD